MSASVGAICSVAKLEHLLHDLLHRGQRVELPPLHLVQDAPQLRVVLNRTLEMRLGTTGCNREHLTGEILAPALLEAPLRLQVSTMLLDLAPELGDAVAPRRLGEDDRRLPPALAV